MPETCVFEPKSYCDNGRTLEWGKNLSTDHKDAMRKGEIFTLLDPNGKPFSTVLMDSYNTIRERRVETHVP